MPCQWPCGNLYAWAHNVHLHIAGTNQPEGSTSQARSIIKLLRVCAYTVSSFIMLLAWLVEPSGWLVPAMCKRTLCAQAHEFPQADWWIGNNWERIKFSKARNKS